jgi:phospholipid/cholesterol/gamma-HCH transport system substrate-binding protein
VQNIRELRDKFGVRRLIAVTVVAVVALGSVLFVGWRIYTATTTTSVTAYFNNTSGIYIGDDVKIMGVNVGKIDQIEPDGDRIKVDFHYDSSYKVPAEAKAVILSQSLISSRAIQLAPAYTGGDALTDGADIPLERTAVPVEWDDFRAQLERLSASLGPTETNKDGALGGMVDSAAEALSGKGDSINQTIKKMSDAMSTLSDGRTDLFGTIQHLQVFVSALAASDQQIVQINGHFASVTDALNGTDHDLSDALNDIDSVTADLQQFVAQNRDGLTKSLDDLAAVTGSLESSKPDIEQILHILPTALANFANIYQPAQGGMTGALAVNHFQNPLQFICGSIQAAAQKGAEESAKLCAQYLAPVLKTLQFNYPPAGINLPTGIQVRPEEIDYSEDSLRPPPGMVDTSVPGVFEPAPTKKATDTVTAGDGLAGLLGALRLPVNGPSGGGR